MTISQHFRSTLIIGLILGSQVSFASAATVRVHSETFAAKSGGSASASAVELAAWSLSASRGLKPLSGADGVTQESTRGGSRCIALKEKTTPPSSYLYFDASKPLPAGAPAWVAVEYFDETIGGALYLEYDSGVGEGQGARYRRAERQAGGFLYDSKKWKKAYFLLKNPRFQNEENLGADFRLTGERIFIRSVRLLSRQPADWSAIGKVGKIEVKPLVKIGPGGQLIVGGFDPAKREDADAQSLALETSAPALKQLGVTSQEVYVRWNLCEIAPNHFDWSVYDKYVDVYKRQHLKWVPFLIIGSAYSLPDWYYKKAGSQGYVCLEHGEESDVQSLWNPTLRQHVSNFIKAFCEHYGKSGVIESILLGVTGNYGEAIYPVSGMDWTADVHGNYHSHPGYWAGDPYAVKDFQAWLKKKFGSIDRLNERWSAGADAAKAAHYGDFTEIRPFLQKDAPNDAAWLDFTDWYIGSMTEYARFWMTETRKGFPKGDIYLCTGGHAPPEHGSDFGEQCRIAAEVKGGVRITNEGSDYKSNFSMTRWVASAGRLYGAYFSFEPAGGVDENGVIARIYNATSSGAKGLHYYYPNLFATDGAKKNFIKWGDEFTQRAPKTEIGVYYPETEIRLKGDSGWFLGQLQTLRDRFDFVYMSDGMIRDGGLKTVKALVFLQNESVDPASLAKIEAWIQSGGLAISPGSAMSELSPAFQAGKGRLVYSGVAGDGGEHRDFLSKTLAEAPELSPGTRAMAKEDGIEDGVFATFCEPNQLLWYNSTDREASKGGDRPVTIPPHGIATQRLTP